MSRLMDRTTGADPVVLMLDEVDRGDGALVGGKGAQLGELSRLDGISVPRGFCVTTLAYRQVVVPAIAGLLDQLAALGPADGDGVSVLSARVRQVVGRLRLPADLERAVAAAVRRLGDHHAYAVRSSATAEDLPTASFAGQHDTYLDVVGVEAVLERIRRCWASLFTERAVAYRARHGIDHRAVAMGVVVQQLLAPRASGVLFTADPVTGHRKVASVQATYGLGEALVAGRVASDVWTVRDGRLVDARVAAQPALSDQEVLHLVELGRRIEAHAGWPQDVEWCLDDEGVRIVQSRPITTLFPIPEADDEADHVYLSVGHGQMMTDPMTPLGVSVWQLTSPAPMRVAGSRLFVDATAILSSPATRESTLATIGRSDPLLRDALDTLLARGEVIPTAPDHPSDVPPAPRGSPEPIPTDPHIVTELIQQERASLAELRRAIREVAGSELFDLILDDLARLRALVLGPRSHQAVMAGIEATWWLDDRFAAWLGEPRAADTLSLGAANNVTAEMGLALLDVADAIRPHPAVVAFLREVDDDGFLDRVAGVEGGEAARGAIVAYLDRYGMRCIGEIDIARPRWSERPSALLPALLADVDHFRPGERARRARRWRRESERCEQQLLRRLRAEPDGDAKAEEAEAMIRRLRTFIGYREYPKYAIVSRYAVYKEALLGEARRLVADGVLDAVDDAFFLTFHELREVTRERRADRQLIARRRAELRSHGALVPPRVLTSDGQALHGAHRREDVPEGALVGLPVSGGTIEGRARVVHDMAQAELAPGDILVTPHTDPSWSPLFLTIAGLVTEVGVRGTR